MGRTGARLRSTAVERGLLGGDHRWAAVGAVVWGAYALRWAMRNTNEPVTLTEPLRPGETLVITSRVPPPRVSRRTRRRLAKAEAKAARRMRQDAKRQAEIDRRNAQRRAKAGRRAAKAERRRPRRRRDRVAG